MSTHARLYYENNAAAMKPVRTAIPGLIKAFGDFHRETMRPAALTVVEKELIAMAIGLVLRCENCIYAHVQAALHAGATRQQILEAAEVAVMMQGGPAYTYLPRVTEALDALTDHVPA